MEAHDIVERGADAEARAKNETTPLMYAAFGGHAEIVRTLLSGGARVDAVTGDGRTALDVSIAEHLKANGYQTAHFGKWHVGAPFRGRDKPSLNDHGFDYWLATDNNAAPSHRNPTNFYRNGKRVGELEGYACQILADEAITWLDNERQPDQPFFLNIWFQEPHDPIAAPDDSATSPPASATPPTTWRRKQHAASDGKIQRRAMRHHAERDCEQATARHMPS